MAAKICYDSWLSFSKLVSLRETFMFFLCVLNFVFSLVAILGNVLVIRALWKASSLPSNLRALFVSLAISDLAVGLTAQPMYAGIIAVMLGENGLLGILCPVTLTMVWFLPYFLVTASFLSVTAIALDRLLALSLHLRYQALVTPKRVAIFIAILWTFSGVAASIAISLPSHYGMVPVSIEVVGLIVTTAAYFQINRVVRYHQNQIHTQQQAQNNQATDFARAKKSALSTVYVYFLFLVCYLPALCAMIALITCDFHISLLAFKHFTVFIIYLNSSLNPFIYCWRYREIRQIVKNMLKKIFVNEPPQG